MENNIFSNFTDFLRTRGLRLTKERRIILEQILLIPRHFEADELYIKLRSENKSISRGTVYNTLTLLEETGIIRKAIFTERHSHFELTKDKINHDHLVCLKCKKIIEFSDNRIINQIKEIGKKKNFLIKKYNLEIYGLCPSCQKRNKRG